MGRYLYQGHFVDRSGNVVNEGTVRVYLANTSTLATAYGSSGGVAVTGSEFSSSANGLFVFWVDETDYATSQRFKVSLSKSGFVPQSYDDIVIFPEVTLTGAQTLTNKTFSGGTITGSVSSTGTTFSGLFGTRIGRPTQNSTQIGSTGTVTGFTQNAASSAKFVSSSSSFTGNYGTKAFTLGDVVKALKKHGILST